MTRFYNSGNSSNQPAKASITAHDDLDPFTRNAVLTIDRNHRVFASATTASMPTSNRSSNSRFLLSFK